MSPSPHVLIVSTKLDVATDVVVSLLDRRGVRATRINSEDFPFDSFLATTVTPNSLTTTYRFGALEPVTLEDVSSIWYRRVRSPERPNTMLQGVYDFCLREARSALLGSILGTNSRIMSPPASIWSAEHKLLQLETARLVGLQIPETVFTNDPNRVMQAFKTFNGKMIAKPIRTGFVDYGSEQQAIFTSQVLESHLERVNDARLSPAIYQPLIPKRFDVRVTAVGSRLFVAEIDSQSDPEASVDWRHTADSHLPHYRSSLPIEVEAGIHKLLSRLGLNFAAIDLIRTPSDQYIFLEVNPSGQWLWLDDMLDLGISEAVADWLAVSRK